MSIELKIKEKHLALEPGIIRAEELKLQEQINYLKSKGKEIGDLGYKLGRLSEHRKNEVRNEARATHLARIFLAGKPYKYAEQKRREDKEWIFQNLIIPRITAMAKKYGGRTYMAIEDKAIKEWAIL
jgi:hypothetical protein